MWNYILRNTQDEKSSYCRAKAAVIIFHFSFTVALKDYQNLPICNNLDARASAVLRSSAIIKFCRCLSSGIAPLSGNARYLVVSALVGAHSVRKWMMAGKIEIRADRKRMKVEGEDHSSALHIQAHIHTYARAHISLSLSISYPYFSHIISFYQTTKDTLC